MICRPLNTSPVLLAALLIAALSACAGTQPVASDGAHLDAVAAEHEGDRPVPGAAGAAPFAPGEVYDQVIDYGVTRGISAAGYIAWPADVDAPVPGIVVIHEWWGLNDNVREMTRRLAGEGYVALAVDLYGGRVATDAATARGLVAEALVDPAAMRTNLHAAHDFLRQRAAAPATGSLGWCFGGGQSLELALSLGGALDAAVMYYGRPVQEEARLLALQAPLLGLFGENDGSIPPASVEQFRQTLEGLGKEATIRIYPDAGHAFANPSGTRYQPEAAADAWQRTLAFFDIHLR